MIDAIYLGTFYLFRFLMRLLPWFVKVPFLDFLGWAGYRIDKKHRHIAKVNLDLAYEENIDEAEKERIIRQVYRHIPYVFAEFIENQGIDRENLLEKVAFEHAEILEDVIARGEKIVFITAHYGFWETGVLAFAAKYGNVTTVGRPLDSKVMNTILEENRRQFGIELLDKKGALKGLIQALKKDRMVGILVDQNTTKGEGILVDFFGKKAMHTTAAAVLARRFNAVIIPVFVTTRGYRQHTLTFYDPIVVAKSDNADADIRRSVEAQAAITEKVIREKPDEWFWLHRRWKNQYKKRYIEG